MAHATMKHGTSQIFTDLQEWTAEQVANHFTQQGYRDYHNNWIQHKITGERAVLLLPSDLEKMGITIIGDRLGIQKDLRELKSHARNQENNNVVMECTEAYNGSNIAKTIRDCCFCDPREPGKYVLYASCLKITNYHIQRCLGMKLGGCLGGIWDRDRIYLDRIVDCDSIQTKRMSCGGMIHKMTIVLTIHAGGDGSSDIARTEKQQLFMDVEEGQKFCQKIQHAMTEYKLMVAGNRDKSA
jgi:hypothetical protein